MMLRDVKDEGKQMSPLFPRLHVNDREKGGPRAPPRNKMALYEQLSIPLQKFSSMSASPSPAASKLGASSASPTQPISSGANRINLVTSASGSPVKYLSGKRDVTASGIKLPPTQEKGNPKTTIISHFGTSSMPRSFTSRAHPTCLERMKDDNVSVSRKLTREDSAAILKRMKLHSGRGNEKVSERNPCSNMVSSSQKQSIVVKQFEPVGPEEYECRKNAQDPMSKKHEMHAESLGPKEIPDPVLSVRVASTASLSPSPCNSRCEPPKRPRESATLESHSSGASLKFPRIKGPLLDDCSFWLNETSVSGDAACLAKSTLHSLPEIKTNHDTREGDGQCYEARQRGMMVTKKCQFPDVVITESASAIGILPDDVVGAIGEKLFWKTRRAIVDQQRVFAVQIFELHRLMEVQKLLSRSPDLVVSCGLGTLKPPTEAVRTTEAPSERPSESSRKDQTSGNPQVKPSTAKIPLPPVNSDIRKDLFAKRPEQMAYPMCYPTAGNHWLVPVMSLSEGLVYKPFSGSYPPTGGEYMAPVYGGCGPISLGPTLGDPNATFRTPSSHHQGFSTGHSYFPPISFPVMNPPDSRFSMGEANLSQFHPPSAHNVSTQISKAVSVCQHGSKSQKINETQGSTGSSPVVPMKGAQTLPLFPVEQPSDKAAGEMLSSNRTRGSVIKVVPHNRKSASESAARIFRSIQEERGRP